MGHYGRSWRDASALLGDRERLRAWAREAGYLYFAGLIPEAVVATLRAEVRRRCAELGLVQASDTNPAWVEAREGVALEGMGYEDARWLRLQQFICPHPAFWAVGRHPSVLAILEQLYGEPAASARGDICRLLMPKSPHQTTRAHQDRSYLQEAAGLWTVWFPLVECPLEQGPLEVLPGSHHRGLWPHGDGYAGIADADADVEGWATGAMQPGDALFFDGLTVHRAVANTSSSRVRVSVDFRYQPSSST